MSARLWIALLLLPVSAPAQTGAALGDRLRRLELDPEHCYRVRDLELQREDIRFYLNDGLLIFSQPAGGRRPLAVFRATEPGDDGEILLRPPDRGERASLARATGSPNLNEHFHTAVFVFGDGGGEQLLKAIQEAGPKPRPEEGLLLASRYADVVRNFAQSFQVRLVRDLLTEDWENGLFYAAVSGTSRGNFDVLHDPTLPEQVIVGEVSVSDPGRFNVWTSFPGRSRRQRPQPPAEEAFVEDCRIEAAVGEDLSLDIRMEAALKPQRRIQGALTFELAPQMTVKAARLNGKSVEIFRRESLRSSLIGGYVNDPFLLILPEPLEAGSVHRLEFELSGNVIRRAGNGVYYVGARTNWYPSRGYHYTNFDLTFRVPKDLRVAATGDIVEEKVEGETRISRFRTSAPVRLAGFNIGSFEEAEAKADGLLVRVFANRTVEPALMPPPRQIVMPPQTSVRLPGRQPTQVITLTPSPPNPQARMRELASEVAAAMQWMQQQFGPPALPTLTVSPIPGNFGQGFPGLVYLSTIAYLPEKDRPAPIQTSRLNLFYSEILLAHEAAHQWWGNVVTSASYRDEWLQEALANYTALMLLERKRGPKALESVLEEYRAELLREYGEPKQTIESAGPITWGARLRGAEGIDPWRVITYCKGSWILHMLRRRMGDAAFLAMLGELRRRHAYQPVTTEQFRALAAEFTAKDDPDRSLEGFFDTWVYGTGIPVLETMIRMRGKAPALEVAVSVKQSGVPEDFMLELPVELRATRASRPVVKWIRTGGDSASVSFRVQAPPARVELAPGAGVLAVRRDRRLGAAGEPAAEVQPE
ncbi:MAG: M1 family aminopeptidase [Bryobacteraceae bacterium]|nr:M1 family aminopeptidase [Bryobacteraceae bacterium]